MSWKNIPGFFAFRRVYDYYLDNIAKDGDTVVEIGCLFGKSIAYLAEKAAARGLKLDIVAVDPWEDTTTGWLPAGHQWREMANSLGGPYEAFQAMLARHSPETKVRVLRMTSHEARKHIDSDSCALVMIDGDHAYEAVVEDIRDWRSAVRSDGLLAGDDYIKLSFPGVVQAVHKVLGDDVSIHGSSWIMGKHDLTPKPKLKVRSDVVFSLKRDAIGVFASAAREYDFASLPDLDEPTILDIGANAGVFACYALDRYPDGNVIAYEPHPETFGRLKGNVVGLTVECHQAALVHPRTAETAPLFEGVNSDIECSLRNDVRWPHVSQDLSRSVEVPLCDSDTLPPCDLLKLDTEGSELEILAGYQHLDKVQVLLIEAHAVGGDLQGQMQKLADLAVKAGLKLLDTRGTTIRFTRMTTVMPAEGWWDVHAVGGERWLGVCATATDGASMKLTHAFRCGADRLIVPVPVPGGSIATAVLDSKEAQLWIPLFLPRPREVDVRWSSRMPLSAEEAMKLLSAYSA